VQDAQGNLWVADFANNRVVMYPPHSATAARVFGQYGSFSTRGCDQRSPHGRQYPRAPSRYTLCQPIGVAVDARGTLYVADSINNRVLIYLHAAEKLADAPADRVLGQSGFHSTASNDVTRRGAGAFSCPVPRPASSCTLSGPMELSLDAQGDLLVPDVDNHRVLLWSAASLVRLESPECAAGCTVPASRVWGQYGSFSTIAANNPRIPSQLSGRCTPIMPFTHPANACTLSGPWAAVADSRGDLFVSDTENSRVLEYDGALKSGRQDATAVYGQGGRMDTATGNLGGVSELSLWQPLGLAFDPEGHLWTTDFYDERVLEFPPPGSPDADHAIRVLGQGGRFDTTKCSVTRYGLCGPTSVFFDGSGDAYVVDGINSRVLEYAAPGA
jgi:DNA-binding beta-propeller fold protein YncE